jgi:2-methylcitrate dehydratase
MDATTARLVEFASQARYSDLAPDLVYECKRRLIDTLACAVGAYDDPLCDLSRNVAKRYAAAPDGDAASIWGCSTRTTPDFAAFANGVMLRVLDLNDMYRMKSGGHPSDVIAPLLAVGEAAHANGAAVINAMVLAYDVYCSFCAAVDANSKGWDVPLYTALASVIGAGKLLDLRREQFAHAIALALVPNLALYQTRTGELSSWKNCAAANASRNAVFAAYLARDGYTGPSAPFEGQAGLWDVMGQFEWRLDAGVHWMKQVHMKCYPVCYHSQAPAWAALELRRKVKVDELDSIDIETYDIAVEHTASDPSRWAPATRETADHSTPYVVAIALIDGEVTAQSFDPHRLTDPRVAALMRRMNVSANAAMSAAYPGSAPCRISAHTGTGRTVMAEVEYPRGHANAPMDDQTIETKFLQMFRGYGNPVQCNAVLEAVWNLDEMKDVGDALKLLVTAD